MSAGRFVVPLALALVAGVAVGAARAEAAPAAATGSTVQAKTEAAPATPAASPGVTMGLEQYRIAAGDTLSVAVEGDTDFTRECQVSGAGTISYPKLGDIPVAGMTCDELRGRIDTGLRAYLRNPLVTVTVRQYGQTGMSVFVMGEVARPGPYPLVSGTGFLQALAAAGGLTESASGEINVLKVRSGQSYVFMLTDLGASGSPAAGMGLEPGDVLLVERKQDARYAVLGEVPKPGMYTMPPRGEVRILDAIQLAGVLPTATAPGADPAMVKPRDILNDPTRAADLEHARLTRDGKDIPIDLAALLRGDTTQNLALQSGDVLTVPRRDMIRVFATGEVRSPGVQLLPRNSTVLDLLNVAGGLTTAARASQAKLVRMEKGQPVSQPVNVGDLLGKGDLQQNVMLHEGDVLFVPAQKPLRNEWPTALAAASLLVRLGTGVW